MSESRRAAVMLIQRGDPEIGGALMAGAIAGRAEAVRATRATSAPGEAGAACKVRRAQRRAS